ncbi:MAG: ABC transporter permease [Acetobacteraceae bacterium]|nr:ABC transporter permease [Acetobacteraceae bacterium]
MQHGVRRVQWPLLALGVCCVVALPFLRHARNRLISGQPIGIGAAGIAAPSAAAALALAALLLLSPALWPCSQRARWTGLAGAGLTVAAGAELAGRVASVLADTTTSSSARTSFGAGAWALVACTLLLGSDTARRLRLSGWRGLAAAVLCLGPIALLLWSGGLGQLALLREYAAQRGPFYTALQQHLLLVAGALVPALLIGLPLGVASQRRANLRRVAMPMLSIVQTIPSIALFGLLIGPLSALSSAVPQLGIAGVGPAPAIIALVLYSLLPIVRNTLEGLDGVGPEVCDAARGMGMTRSQVFWRVEAWLALPVVLSGLRVTTVQAVGLASVSALIGAGGFGAIMFQGLFANALDLVLLGALPVIALAVLADLAFRALGAWAQGTLA